MAPFVSVLGVLPWFAWIAIVAIICGAITKWIRSMQQHNERIEMIRQGMHPDAPESRTRRDDADAKSELREL